MNPFYKNLALWLVITMMMFMLYKMFNTQNLSETPSGYSDFLTMVDENRVEEVVIQGQELHVTDTEGRRYKIYAPQDADLIRTLRANNIRINAKPPTDSPCGKRYTSAPETGVVPLRTCTCVPLTRKG